YRHGHQIAREYSNGPRGFQAARNGSSERRQGAAAAATTAKFLSGSYATVGAGEFLATSAVRGRLNGRSAERFAYRHLKNFCESFHGSLLDFTRIDFSAEQVLH